VSYTHRHSHLTANHDESACLARLTTPPVRRLADPPARTEPTATTTP